MNTQDVLGALGLSPENLGTFAGHWLQQTLNDWLISHNPADGTEIARLTVTSDEQYERVIAAATENFTSWQLYPAPKRGEVVRQIADELRRHKEPLGRLVSLETGKILQEGLGEIQEAIDIADFAVGLSRQLYGLSMHSERPSHRMYEQWHPLGNVGVITAFNFPAAVWAWNAMIAAVCGNSVVWKPSEHTPLVARALIEICSSVAAENGFPSLFTLITGNGPQLGARMAEDRRVPLVSATGSCGMGRSVGQAVAARLGRSLLELGGNNAVIILPDADMDIALRGVVFGAVGTAGQRCTTTRRLFLHKDIKKEFLDKLVHVYKQVKIGNPLDAGTLMGPLITQRAVDGYLAAVAKAKTEGARLLFGGRLVKNAPSPLFVEPTLFDAPRTLSLLREETFAPILYAVEIESLEDGIALNNAVPQGLSSAVFTNNFRHAERFLSQTGSDCGIANVNLGTSGAEIGGAFGGEKETGGGRESGSDSWKAYMRRQTNTLNWGDDLPLAQGIQFL